MIEARLPTASPLISLEAGRSRDSVPLLSEMKKLKFKFSTLPQGQGVSQGDSERGSGLMSSGHRPHDELPYHSPLLSLPSRRIKVVFYFTVTINTFT